MKKSNIWIHTCVHLLLYITVAAYSSKIGNPITDDIKKISLLKQNIPKDYNITVRYLPKEVSGMCWVKLNIFHLEKSLDLLANKFGNISSNKDNIGTLVQMLREMRYYIGDDLEDDMFNFECHYRKVEWLTGRYFKFVEDFFNTANSSQEDGECDPPPCPTTIKTTPTISVSTQHHSKVSSEWNSTAKEGTRNQIFLPDTLERGLLALLFIPLIAVGFLLIWKVKSRRTPSPLQRDMDGPPLFIGVEASAPPLDDEMSEKNRLNIRAV
ncbi:kit ligand a isoform X2 [Electrophorus electricus]|uniref:Kit ligand n=1 Tax=Electrophorus electricus TaxID=8005 RepID=A0A4W4EW09_ELEEL|nr:kit ligand a isoform X2 [Electrophorus electricus]